MRLGVASLRANNAKRHDDAAKMEFPNNAGANEYPSREYRSGYSL